jgi:hypothetical protein
MPKKSKKKQPAPLPPPKKVVKTAKAIQRETKKTGSQIKRTIQTLSKVIKNAIQKKTSTRKTPKKASAKKTASLRGGPQKRATPKSEGKFTLQKLANSRSKNLAVLASNIESRTDEIDSILKPNQMWVIQLWKRDVLVPFSSISGVSDVLNRYLGVWDDNEGLISNIGVVTIGRPEISREDSVRTFHRELQEKKAETIKMNKDIQANARRLLGSKSDDGRRKTTNELLRDAILLADAERNRAESTESRLAKLEKQLSNLLNPKKSKKKAAKKSTKKVSTKNETKRSVTRKPATKSSGSKARVTASKPKKSARKSATKKSVAKAKGNRANPKSSPKKSATKKSSAKRVVKKGGKKK